MSTHDQYFDVEERGTLGVLALKPHVGVALADISYAQGILGAIKKFESDGMTVLLVTVPAENFAPDRMEAFWDSSREESPDKSWLSPRHSHYTTLPMSVQRMESGVSQVLALLQSTRLFKVIAVEGDIDFDLLGLLLAFDARFCSRDSSFHNRLAARGAVPGFGVVWYLARHLGHAQAVDLILNHGTLTAEAAKNIGLLTSLSDVGESAAAARAYAEKLANLPAMLLANLAQASKHRDSEFEEYLDKIGAGFKRMPRKP